MAKIEKESRKYDQLVMQVRIADLKLKEVQKELRTCGEVEKVLENRKSPKIGLGFIKSAEIRVEIAEKCLELVRTIKQGKTEV